MSNLTNLDSIGRLNSNSNSSNNKITKKEIVVSENYLDDLSYSVHVEKISETKIREHNLEPLSSTLPRKTRAWIDDNTVKSCYKCNAEFTIWLRRHHCRLCGKIFCYECSKYKDVIPDNLLSEDSKRSTWNDYLTSYLTIGPNNCHRLCIFCHKLIEKLRNIKKLIDAFKIMKLDLKELKKAGSVCKLWHYSMNYYLSIFREIQYKLPGDEYTDFEKDLLLLNMKYIIGHNRYFIHLCKICDSENQIKNLVTIFEDKNTRRVSCMSMMCSRNCHSKLNNFDCINLLSYCFQNNKLNTNEFKQLCFKTLMLCNDKEFKCYIPFLTYHIRNDEELLGEFLVNKCIKNFNLLNALYWELQLYPKDVYHEEMYGKLLKKLKTVLSEKKYEDKFIKLLEGTSFVKMVENISSAIYVDNKKYHDIYELFSLKSDLFIPIGSKNHVHSILLDKIKIKDSATRPMILPCVTDDDKIFSVMYKKEDVRKDQMIMNIIKLMDIIVKKEENIDLGIITYDILPTSTKDGLIEMVDNSDTIYFIQEKLNTSITNYILESNGDLKIKEMKERFIKSTAAYCVITYLLGVGDRHLDNIMITKDGRLFHIDFGYILGKDPVFNNPGIRITHEMLEAIGGVGSNYYNYFKELCTKIFNCLRRNIDIFMNLLLLLPKISDINLTESEIKYQLIKRFAPGETNIEAQLSLVNQLEKKNYTDNVKDWFHYHSKEKTLNSTIFKFTSTISSLLIANEQEKNK